MATILHISRESEKALFSVQYLTHFQKLSYPFCFNRKYYLKFTNNDYPNYSQWFCLKHSCLLRTTVSIRESIHKKLPKVSHDTIDDDEKGSEFYNDPSLKHILSDTQKISINVLFDTVEKNPPSPIRQKKIYQYLELLNETCRNGGTVTQWNDLAEKGEKDVWHMSSHEIPVILKAFAQAKYWNHSFIAKLFTVLMRHQNEALPSEIIMGIQSGLQMGLKQSFWVMGLIEVFVTRIKMLFYHPTPLSNVTFNSHIGTNSLDYMLNKDNGPLSQARVLNKSCIPTVLEVIQLATCLSYYQIYKTTFWPTLCTYPGLTHLPLRSAVVLLEAFSRMKYRDINVLDIMVNGILSPIDVLTLHSPHIKGLQLNAFDTTDLSVILRGDIALIQLDAHFEEWINAVNTASLNDLRISKNKETLHYARFLFHRVCMCPLTFTPESLIVTIMTYLRTTDIEDDSIHELYEVLLFLKNTRQTNILQHIDSHWIRTIEKRYNTTKKNIKTKELDKSCFKLNRWKTEVQHILKHINIRVESTHILIAGESYFFPFTLPKKKIILWCLGPFSYYVNITKTTARTNMLLRILNSQGYQVVTIPYYEWTLLKKPLDKKLYICKLGRKAAHEEV